jgi:hypothetical protein
LYPELYQGTGETRQEVAEFGIKWGWYQSIYGLAKGDIFKFESVTKLKLHKALLFLSFEASKNKLEANLIKRK